MKTVGGNNLSPAYVTGGSSGIGFAIARELRSRGISLALFARNGEKLRRAAGDLADGSDGSDGSARSRRPGASGSVRPSIHTFQLDVSDPEAVRAAFDRAEATLGPPRTVIHAAGSTYPDYFEGIDEARFRELLEVNLAGTWYVLQESVARMRRAAERPSFILTLSSQAGLMPVFGYTAYGATKFAVHGLSLALRQELYREGIYVSVLAPPDTDTPQLDAEAAVRPPETARLAGAAPLDPRRVARQAVRGLYRRRPLIVPGIKAKLEVLAYRILPGLGDLIIRRIIKGVSRDTKTHTR